MKKNYLFFFAFLISLSAWTQQIYSVFPNPAVQGKPIKVVYSFKGTTFNAGNVFTLQLSDSKGSFAAASDIDTFTSIADTGIFFSVIPTTQMSGAGYRVRIVSSNPALSTGVNNSNLIVINSRNANRSDLLQKTWDARFGGVNIEILMSSQQTSDMGYILGGYTLSDSGSEVSQISRGQSDFWMMKIDSFGQKQWDARFGGSFDDLAQKIIQTSDGGYLIGGYTKSAQTGDKSQGSRGIIDYWVVKTDSIGQKMWDKRFGGSQTDCLYDLIETSDHSYVLVGMSNSNANGDKSEVRRGVYDYWMVKIDSIGTKVWDKRFGGDGNDYASSVLQTPDGGFLLGGTSESGQTGDKSESSRGDIDYLLVKTDASGNKIWDKRYGGSLADSLHSMAFTNDNGYILAGESNSGANGDKSQISQGGKDFWIVKIDSLGGVQWNKRYGGSADDLAFSVIPTITGEYFIAGTSLSDSTGDKLEKTRGKVDYWVVKSDSIGNKLWDKRFGGTDEDYLRNMQLLSGGGLLLSGFSMSAASADKSQSCRGIFDHWIVKLDYPNMASFTIKEDTQCIAKNYFAFEYTGQIGKSFLWNFGENSSDTSTIIKPIKTYAATGNYTVTLKVTDSLGYTDSTTMNVTLLPGPYSSFTVNDSLQQINNNSFVFTNTSAGAQTYSWNFGYSESDTSTKTNPSKSYMARGNYIVKLIATYTTNGCKDSSIHEVKVMDQQVFTTLPNPTLPRDTLLIPFVFDDKMDSNNIYTLYLSNSNGSFSNSTVLDTMASSSSSGVFKSVIPSDQSLGTGYRVRVSSSHPGLLSRPNNSNIGLFDYYTQINDSFAKQWDKAFGAYFSDVLISAEHTRDKAFILGGYSDSGQDNDKSQPSWGYTDFWIVKADSNGNKLWDKRYGGTGNDYFSSLQQTIDGGYILGGYSGSDSTGDKTQKSFGLHDYWIVKIDSVGNKKWDKRYGGSGDEKLGSVRQTSDG
ncbi:MAG: hypothetical protein HYZ42_13190, partial [Bacteroidetes bacterium]|nr:hypothetical protein [Bacteroidota bacterium]